MFLDNFSKKTFLQKKVGHLFVKFLLYCVLVWSKQIYNRNMRTTVNAVQRVWLKKGSIFNLWRVEVKSSGETATTKLRVKCMVIIDMKDTVFYYYSTGKPNRMLIIYLWVESCSNAQKPLQYRRFLNQKCAATEKQQSLVACSLSVYSE